MTISASAAIAEPTAFSVMDGRLTQLDMATGDVTDLGDLGLSQVGGMTMTSAGELLAVDGWSDELWRIDPRTATASRIGRSAPRGSFEPGAGSISQHVSDTGILDTGILPP